MVQYSQVHPSVMPSSVLLGSFPAGVRKSASLQGGTSSLGPKNAEVQNPCSQDTLNLAAPSMRPAQPKFGSKLSVVAGSVIGGTIGGISALMIGIPSLLMGFVPFLHGLWGVALASPLLIPAGMLVGGLIGKDGKSNQK